MLLVLMQKQAENALNASMVEDQILPRTTTQKDKTKIDAQKDMIDKLSQEL